MTLLSDPNRHHGLQAWALVVWWGVVTTTGTEMTTSRKKMCQDEGVAEQLMCVWKHLWPLPGRVFRRR